MRCFPQLATGAPGQYPLYRARRTRTVVNRLADGRSIRLADPAAQTTEWRLCFEELTDGERAALEEFFITSEGCLHPFTFLDPAGNLLRWSEQLDRVEWEKDPFLGLTGGMADPLGGAAAWTVVNAGAAPQALCQTLQAPASYYYCLSVYARSETGGEVTLIRGDQRAPRTVGPRWSRLVLAAESASPEESVRLGVEVAAGMAVELFGFQAEPQTGASAYRRTRGRGGVYPGARFGADELSVTTRGPGRHACRTTVIHGGTF